MKILVFLMLFIGGLVQAAEPEEVNLFVASTIQLESVVFKLNLCVTRTPVAEGAKCWDYPTSIATIHADLKNIRECLKDDPSVLKSLDAEQREQLEMDLGYLNDIMPASVLPQLQSDVVADLSLLNTQMSVNQF